MTRAFSFTCMLLALLTLLACSPAPGAKQKDEPKPEAPPPTVVPEEPAPEAPLALHMRDHLGITTQARDALIRGQLEAATGSLTWLAQHREPNPAALARPFLEQVHQHAQRALDSSDLRTAGEAIGALAASCGDCHRAQNAGPKLEPSGFEDLDDELTVATHMHGYLWATDALWNALIADAALWDSGVSTLAGLTPPSKPSKLAPGFAAIRAWGIKAKSITGSADRGRAFGELIALCGGCHVAYGINPGGVR